MIKSCEIKVLFDTMAKNVFVTKDNRYIGSLPDIELQYYDEKTGQVRWGQVDFIQKHFVDKPTFQISFENGSFVVVTEDHSLVVKRNENVVQTKVYQLQQNDQFYTLNGWTKMNKITPQERYARWVYDIQMKDNPHTFFANGVLVHNSVFIKLKVDENTLKEQLEKLNGEMLLNDLIMKYNPNIDMKYYQYELEYEKHLKYLYLGDKKKRYYSIMDNGKKYIHGLNIIRKDTPERIKELLDGLCEIAITGNFNIKHLEEVFEKIKVAEYDEIAVHKSFSKRFDAYNKTRPSHVSGALFANEHLDMQIKHSDVVYLFYINSFCEPDIKLKDRRNVICLRKEDFEVIKTTDKFEIDYVELMEKQFIQPLREFDKIDLVAKALDDWAIKMKDNYRLSKTKGYLFKKKA